MSSFINKLPPAKQVAWPPVPWPSSGKAAKQEAQKCHSFPLRPRAKHEVLKANNKRTPRQSRLDVVKQLYPEDRIILYGSRAIGDVQKDSDWDFLILIDKDIPEKEKLKIRYALFEIEWETDEVISSIIHSKNEWSNPIMQATPFYRNIVKEGINI